ncbi:MAG: hypothetical protein AAF587_27880 [Bacteroidota bacterium]
MTHVTNYEGRGEYFPMILSQHLTKGSFDRLNGIWVMPLSTYRNEKAFGKISAAADGSNMERGIQCPILGSRH